MEQNNTSNIRNAVVRILGLLRLDKSDITSIYIYSIFAGVVSLSLPLGIQAIIGFVMAGSLSTSIVILIGLDTKTYHFLHTRQVLHFLLEGMKYQGQTLTAYITPFLETIIYFGLERLMTQVMSTAQHSM